MPPDKLTHSQAVRSETFHVKMTRLRTKIGAVSAVAVVLVFVVVGARVAYLIRFIEYAADPSVSNALDSAALSRSLESLKQLEDRTPSCPEGKSPCGTLCFSPATQSCHLNALPGFAILCPFGLQPCGLVCFTPAKYECRNEWPEPKAQRPEQASTEAAGNHTWTEDTGSHTWTEDAGNQTWTEGAGNQTDPTE